jgi:hypothetical protein
MASRVQVQVLQALNRRVTIDRLKAKELPKWDARGIVEANTPNGYRVRTALGNTFYARADRVNTNAQVVKQRVVTFRPKMGGGFIDGVIRGK